MTPERKEQLTALIDEVKAVQTKLEEGLLTEAETIRDDQDENSEEYEAMNEIAESLDTVYNTLQEAIDGLDTMLGEDVDVFASDEDTEDPDEDDLDSDGDDWGGYDNSDADCCDCADCVRHRE